MNATNIDVIRVALQQYGYTEKPAGSNRTKYGKAYGVDGVPWCAIFDWWCGEQPKGDNPIFKSYNAADIQDDTVRKKGGTWVLPKTRSNVNKRKALEKVRFGDIVDFDFGANDGIRDHTSLAVGRHGNYYVCIEGNTSFGSSGSQSNGGCVALRNRHYTEVNAIVRPKYTIGKWYKPTKPYEGKVPQLPSKGCIKYGDNSVDVRRLQKMLTWANGYELKADKQYGGKTFAEVVIFQMTHNLVPDGIFGTKTRAKIVDLSNGLNVSNKIYTQPTKPAQNESKSPTEAHTTTKPPALYKPTTGDKCYDLSAYQGKLSVDYFSGIKKKGVKCVILRSSWSRMATGKMYVDECFDNNIKNAIKAGMHIGVYHFSAAINAAEAKAEALYCLKTIKPYMKHIDLPVAFDCEFGVKNSHGSPRFTARVAKALGRKGMEQMIDGFCDTVKSAGYGTMVYANLTMYNNYLPADIYKRRKIWIAQYYKTCEYKHQYYMWQYTSNNGRLDENVFGEQGLPKPAKESAADKIMSKAVEYAYPAGTDKSRYEVKTGKPKPTYTKALDKIFPRHKEWKKEIRNGASCSVFVATCVRAASVDKTFRCDDPPKIIDYMEKSQEWKKVNTGRKPLPQSELKSGDVIAYEKTGAHGNGHILLYKGNGYIVEANFGRCYPHTSKIPKAYLNESYIRNTYKQFVVYRAK